MKEFFYCLYSWFFLRGVLLILFATIFSFCDNQERKNAENLSKKSTDIQKDSIIDKPDIQSKIFLNHDSIGGWGYDIIISNVKYIHQTNMPVFNGTKGFVSKDQAQKVADLVINKIKNNIMPPAISLHEMDSLSIKK